MAERINSTVGVKVEDGDFTSMEYQPNLRFAYFATDTTTFWSAISRAARTPAPIERILQWRYGLPAANRNYIDSNFPGTSQFVYVETIGNPDYSSEIATTTELGLRTYPSNSYLIDIALYSTQYKNLQSFTYIGLKPNNPVAPYTSTVLSLDNEAEARSTGVEIATQLDVSDTWNLKASYSYTDLDTKNEFEFGADLYTILSSVTPRNIIVVRSHHDLFDAWAVDWKLKYIDETYDQKIHGIVLDAYWDISLAVSYRVAPQTTLSLIGKQLGDPERLDTIESTLNPIPTEVQRSIYIQLDWH